MYINKRNEMPKIIDLVEKVDNPYQLCRTLFKSTKRIAEKNKEEFEKTLEESVPDDIFNNAEMDNIEIIAKNFARNDKPFESAVEEYIANHLEEHRQEQ